MSTGDLVFQSNGLPRQKKTALIATLLLTSIWFDFSEAHAAPPPKSKGGAESRKSSALTPRPTTRTKASTKASQRPAKRRLFTWMFTGLAAGLATSAVIVGLSAKSKYDELMDTCVRPCSASRLRAVRNRAIVTDVLWGTAAGAFIAAVVFYFVERHKPKEKDKRSNTTTSTWNNVRVKPLVRTRTYGLSAEIQF